MIANVNPQYLFQTLLPRGAVPPAVAARMKAWKAGSGTFRMNLALSKLPDFTALPGAGDHHTAGIILARAFRTWIKPIVIASTYGWSRKPIVELVIPSTFDDSLAPPGDACGEPLLPACKSAIYGRLDLGRAS